jgi:thiosulfate/3-mercaptopyruvate sulfurtransferase
VIETSITSTPPQVTVTELLARQAEGTSLVLVDCRFNLGDQAWGEKEYVAGHLPGAVYADLERDLSGTIVRGKTGRHPLPQPEAFARLASQWGIDGTTRVVAYDDGSNMFAPRLWWLLHYFGHPNVAVLSGGVKAWLAADGALETSRPSPHVTSFVARPNPSLVAALSELEAHVTSGNSSSCLLDARATPRFRGEHEPIDAVAGHIPTARNLPFNDLLDVGVPKSERQVRTLLQNAIAPHAPTDVVAYCGSGVTACALIWAAACAGIFGIRLYPGSWSEWITSESRPVERG